MNRQQLRDQIKTYCMIPEAGDGTLTDPRLNQFIDRSLERYTAKREWPWLLTSSSLSFATDGTATLPTAFNKAKRDGLIINSAPVHFVELSDYLDQTGRQWSYVWTVTGTTARIDPAPASTTSATLWYFRTEPALSTETSSPLLPAIHHHMLCAFAAHLGWLAKGDSTRAQLWYSEFENAMDEMRDDARTTTGPGRIRTRRDSIYATWA